MTGRATDIVFIAVGLSFILFFRPMGKFAVDYRVNAFRMPESFRHPIMVKIAQIGYLVVGTVFVIFGVYALITRS